MAAATLPRKGDPEAMYVIDISSFVFRAYHALPPLSSSRGEPTHAVAGVANMLAKLLKDHEPASIVVAMDSKNGSFRKDRFPAYKANRPAAPPDLKQQMLRVRELVQVWGMHPIEVDAIEADDIIATIVHQCRGTGRKVVMVSADKDLLQLVGDGVVMYDSMRDRVFGEEETVEKFGVPPSQVRDLLALMGDSSDNIPGVPSVGQKTAAKLLQDYGDLDGIYAHLDEITRKALKAKLAEHRESAELSRELVTLKDDVPLGIDAEAVRYQGGDTDKLRQLFADLEFTRLLAQLEPETQVQGRYELVVTLDGLQRVAREIRNAGAFSFYTVLHEDSPIRGDALGIALSWGEGVGVYVPFGHQSLLEEQLSAVQVEEWLQPLLTNALIGKSCRIKRELLIWGRRGVVLRGLCFDPPIASYLLDPGRHAHALEDVARHELGADLLTSEQVLGKGKQRLPWDHAELEQIKEYAAQRADYLLRLQAVMKPRFSEGALGDLMGEIELPLAEVLSVMERTGVRVDVALLEQMSEEASQQLQVLEARCTELAGHEFNVSSPRQLETILFDELGLPVIKKTKTARSTDQQVLEELSLLHDLPLAIVEHRMLSKLKSTYLDALPREVHPSTGRIHTRYNQLVAATGRLSSSDPNLQNIPIRTDEGRRIRQAFIPADGWLMFSADYSQIELRVLAELSQDKELVEAYSNNEDVHVRTATAIFGVKPDEVTREMRARAKTVNFAVIYGQTQFALARNLKIERREAKRYIDAFFERYSGVRAFMDKVVEEARDKGYVTTLLGRKRNLADIRSSNHNLRSAAERIACNTPLQGTAADIIKIAMVRIQHGLEAQGLQSRMVLTVHDELVFEAPPDEKEALEKLVVDGMQNASPLALPLPVESGWGPNWGEAH